MFFFLLQVQYNLKSVMDFGPAFHYFSDICQVIREWFLLVFIAMTLIWNLRSVDK